MDLPAPLHHLINNPLFMSAAPVFVVLVTVEVVVDIARGRRLYALRDTGNTLFLVASAWIVELAPRGAALVMMDSLHQVSPFASYMAHQWWVWPLALLADDLVFYFWHRSSHEIRILWAGHVTHHSSLHFNLSTGIRAGVGERLTKPFFWLPLALLGFSVDVLVIVSGVSLLYQMLLHTQLVGRLPGWIEMLFNTPSHHRVHHASNPCYLDRNHGGVLIIWDRLFGTFSEEANSEPCRYGLTGNIGPVGPVRLVMHEYLAILASLRLAQGWRERLRCIFGPPSWSPETLRTEPADGRRHINQALPA